MINDLKFDDSKYTIENISMDGEEITYRAFENIIYVEKPVDIAHQNLSIFVPECYYEGKSIGRYNIENAPIFMPNTVGGYMPGKAERPGKNFMGKTNATFWALKRGYVVVSPSVRGRELKDKNNKFIGTAPAVIVDLKAAIRYLRFNKETIPGDVEKIISNGTSAGGAISSLLGASGNHSDYEEYLKEIGAADERDDIFAASCYCPITNLDHADMAYEWEFYGLNDYHRMKFEHRGNFEKPKMIPIDGVMTEFQQELSKKVKNLFPEYVNSLKLKDDNGELLVLDNNGNGSFKDFIKKYVLKSIKLEMEKGKDLSDLEWITIENGEPVDIDFDKYIRFRTRMKDTLAFDSIEAKTPENELFGTKDIQYRHFTKFAEEHSQVDGELADEKQIKMMNPMYYINDDTCTTSKYYRIRHGAVDRDTSLAISAMLTLMLRDQGVEVDYHLPWGLPHAGDYDLNELFDWIEEITK